jgi:predicted alpha/beta-fold hydrolase
MRWYTLMAGLLVSTGCRSVVKCDRISVPASRRDGEGPPTVKEYVATLEHGIPFLPRKLPALLDLAIYEWDGVPQTIRDQFPSTAGKTNRYRRIGPFEDVQIPVQDNLHLEGRASLVKDSRPWVILVHGLFRSNTSRLIRDSARILLEEGYGVLVLDMREFGLSMKETLFTTTLGWREGGDILRAAEWVRREKGATAVSVLGFSLGGRYTIRAAIEARQMDPAPITSAMAVVPAISAEGVVRDLERSFLTRLAARGWKTLLKVRYRRNVKLSGKEANDSWLRKRDLTMRDAMVGYLDGTVLNGVGRPGGEEILRQSDSLQGIEEVTIPLLVYGTRDDPLIQAWQYEEHLAPRILGNPNIGLIVAEKGAHHGVLVVEPRYFLSVMTNFVSQYGRKST